MGSGGLFLYQLGLRAMMREKPTPPEDYECCESGCSPCVWDTYYEDVQLWQAEQNAEKNTAEQAAVDVKNAE
jgi:hypothetical protein